MEFGAVVAKMEPWLEVNFPGVSGQENF